MLRVVFSCIDRAAFLKSLGNLAETPTKRKPDSAFNYRSMVNLGQFPGCAAASSAVPGDPQKVMRRSSLEADRRTSLSQKLGLRTSDYTFWQKDGQAKVLRKCQKETPFGMELRHDR
jgi:hypothetical protein